MTEPANTTPEPAPQLTASRLRWIRVVAVVLVTGTTALTVALASKYPALASVNAGLAWLAGKLLGVPLQDVMQAALRAMQPADAVKLTVAAVRSMPPAKAEAVAQTVLSEIASHAVGAMEPARAEYITRAILDTMPPEEKARVLERVVFVSQKAPPAAAAPPSGDSNGDD